jgi:FtsP/CotA-like multicopper oxidase with cupredoxin domain
MTASRREFLRGAAALGGALLIPGCGQQPGGAGSASGAATAPPRRPDFSLRIARVVVEPAPGRQIATTGYDGSVPGPLLRMREGVPVIVEVHNDTAAAELVHWHGQAIAADADGAEEEGTALVPARGLRRYTFTPGPAGTRWYHTQVHAGSDLERGTYSGQFGFVVVAAKSEPGRYDREVFLATHEWEPFLTGGAYGTGDTASGAGKPGGGGASGATRPGVAASPGATNPSTSVSSSATKPGTFASSSATKPGTSASSRANKPGPSTNPGADGHGSPAAPPTAGDGLEIGYRIFSINGKALGHGEPVRVRQGERVLFHLLNAGAGKLVRLALPGHRFQVTALDGNPVPTRATVDVLQLAAGERVDAVVEMDRPGVWVLGSTSDSDRAAGCGVVVEYAGQSGKPRWLAPPQQEWNYAWFGGTGLLQPPDKQIPLIFGRTAGAAGGFDRWTVNGRSYPQNSPIYLLPGWHYRLLLRNESDQGYPVHLHRHSFQITKLNGRLTAGIVKDVVHVEPHSSIEVDMVADNPGPTLFHCQQQLPMDNGFMVLFQYI